MTESFLSSAEPEPRHRRRWLWVSLAIATLMLVTAAVWPIAAGRTDPPVYARAVAENALREARRLGAQRWANDVLVAAEAQWRAASAEFRRQESKWFPPLRDYRGARAALAEAEKKSIAARDAAQVNRAAARDAAQAELARAGEIVELSARTGDAVHLVPYHRRLLQKSKIQMAEARILFEREEYATSSERARAAAVTADQVASGAKSVLGRFTDPGLIRNWRNDIEETIAASRRSGSPAIVVLKENRRLDLYDNGRLVKSYLADMGYRSFNDKLRAGDAATPEGRYRITSKRGTGSAAYYKAFDLDYPNAADRAQFDRLKRQGKLPRGAKLGGSIQVHGEGGRGKDWTRGCVAVSNRDMDDLFRRVGIGTPVTIVGGDGQGVYAKLARQAASTTTSGTR
ncbi:MAG TPA: L,D-transpeptidase [Candidatus Polarisedimenticolaceae bacterium]